MKYRTKKWDSFSFLFYTYLSKSTIPFATTKKKKKLPLINVYISVFVIPSANVLLQLTENLRFVKIALFQKFTSS